MSEQGDVFETARQCAAQVVQGVVIDTLARDIATLLMAQPDPAEAARKMLATLPTEQKPKGDPSP